MKFWSSKFFLIAHGICRNYICKTKWKPGLITMELTLGSVLLIIYLKNIAWQNLVQRKKIFCFVFQCGWKYFPVLPSFLPWHHLCHQSFYPWSLMTLPLIWWYISPLLMFTPILLSSSCRLNRTRTAQPWKSRWEDREGGNRGGKFANQLKTMRWIGGSSREDEVVKGALIERMRIGGDEGWRGAVVQVEMDRTKRMRGKGWLTKRHGNVAKRLKWGWWWKACMDMGKMSSNRLMGKSFYPKRKKKKNIFYWPTHHFLIATILHKTFAWNKLTLKWYTLSNEKIKWTRQCRNCVQISF